MKRRAFVAATFASALWANDLDTIKKEPSPERRYERALDLMDASLKEAQDLQRQGSSPAAVLAKIEETVVAAEYSLESLRQTGKRPNKLTRQYKRGELRTRDALRKLEGLVQTLDFDDRATAANARNRLQTVQDDYLAGVMYKS